MRILLTGSSGRLGRVLASMLRDAGHDVFGLDPVAGPDTDAVGSVADRPLLDQIFADRAITAVVHAGGLHQPNIARYPKQAFVDVNVGGTLALVEAAVAAGCDRFVLTSTTSLMVSQDIREGAGNAAVWLDEASGPLAPRNIYGVTRLAAEDVCRLAWLEHRLPCIILRTSRFFPGAEDEPGLTASEFLHRRLTVEDAARAHVTALDRAPALGFELFIVSAPPPFLPTDAVALMDDAPAVVARCFPDAPALYAARGWRLPSSIGRVYDPGRAERLLGFRCRTDFAAVLGAMRQGRPLPFAV